MSDPVGQKLFDGINHPSGATVTADGFVGGILYGGSPASQLGKDFTAAQYTDYVAHGLWMGFVFELSTTDIDGGYSMGVIHAQDMITDLANKGVSNQHTVFWAVDEHLTTAQLPTALAYGQGFMAEMIALGWDGPIGPYGPAELIGYVHDHAPQDCYWGWGSQSAQPSYLNIWQDNNAHATVGGSTDDIDHILISVPTKGTPPVTNATVELDFSQPLGYTSAVTGQTVNTTVGAALANACHLFEQYNIGLAGHFAEGPMAILIQGLPEAIAAVDTDAKAADADAKTADADVKAGTAALTALLAAVTAPTPGQPISETQVAEIETALASALAQDISDVRLTVAGAVTPSDSAETTSSAEEPSGAHTPPTA
jgi:hypothetical protein